jgi:hypothetical protein
VPFIPQLLVFSQALCFALFSTLSVAIETGNATKADDVQRLIAPVLPKVTETDLGKNLKLLEDYYQQIDRSLNAKLQRGARDPFEPLVQAESPMSVPERGGSRFIPELLNTFSRNLSADSVSAVAIRPVRKSNVMLPAMKLKGFMRVDGVSTALLEVEGVGAVVVKEGDKFGMGRLGSEDEAVIQVVEINKLNVIVEAGSLGERIVVQ